MSKTIRKKRHELRLGYAAQFEIYHAANPCLSAPDAFRAFPRFLLEHAIDLSCPFESYNALWCFMKRFRPQLTARIAEIRAERPVADDAGDTGIQAVVTRENGMARREIQTVAQVERADLREVQEALVDQIMRDRRQTRVAVQEYVRLQYRQI